MNLEIVCRQAVSWLDLDSSRKILLSVGKDNVIKLWNIKEILEVRIFSSLSLSLSELCVRCFFLLCVSVCVFCLVYCLYLYLPVLHCFILFSLLCLQLFVYIQI